MKTSNKLWRKAVLPLTAGLLLLESASSYAARCEYVIQSEWGSGFVAGIRITNDTNTAINGWSVNWSYADGSKRTGGWNANFSGNNPYSATNVGWNSQINPGQTAEFGIQGNKGVQNAPAAKPTITGAVCGQASSVSSLRSSTSRSFSSSSSWASLPGSTSKSSSSSRSMSSSLASRSSSSFSSPSRSSSSFGISSTSTSRSMSSSSSYSGGPNLPLVDLQVSVHGMTVHVDTSGSTDLDGDKLYHSISFGDGASLAYPNVWHTYKEPGTYVIEAKVSDVGAGGRSSTNTYPVTVEVTAGNQAPIARLAGRRAGQSIEAYGRASFDLEGEALTYEWDFGEGSFIGGDYESLGDCWSSVGGNERYRNVMLTVSDGKLKDTIQATLGGRCGTVYDVASYAKFTYQVYGNTVSVDASGSRNDTGFSWDFGDGTKGVGLKASHTYASPGTYSINLVVSSPSPFRDEETLQVVIGAANNSSSFSAPSSFGVSTSSRSTSFGSTSSRSISLSSISSRSASFSSSTSRSMSSSSYSGGPNLPDVDLQVSVHGMTVHVDTSGSTDIDGDKLFHSISFGDGASLSYPDVWHTYKEPGTYMIEAKVSDLGAGGRSSIETYPITVEVTEGNQAPIARLSGRRFRDSLDAYGRSSFDWEGTPLTYEWDFGDGPFVGSADASLRDCNSSSSSNSSSKSSSSSSSYDGTRLVTLTVSDGEFKDTVQRTLVGPCGLIHDLSGSAEFSYVVEGNKILVDGSASSGEIGFNWSFGDGTRGSGLFASHTYASPGTYQVSLYLTNMGSYGSPFDNITKSIVIGSVSSVTSSSRSSSSHVSSPYRSSSSFMSSSTSSRAFDSAVSLPSSSLRSSSSQRSSDRNLYIAQRATTAPVIDGVVDSVWERASWSPINVFWLGTQSNPSAQDYSGRYKALWDENYLYVLYDITDDRIYDGVRDALDRYWEDDTVELFIDENKNGGQHGYNTSAWAYHISTYGDVVDSTTGGAKLLNDHIDSRLVSNGTQHYWELRIRIYGEDYADWKSNTPLQLYAGKLMGFSACYIDNDGSSQRESMMGSVDTQGHKNNQGYLDASVFGSMLLTE